MDGTGDAPRLLLVTGLGGAGRTTVAAATAVAAAAHGAGRTLLLTTEEDGVLDQVLGTPIPAGAPAEAAPGLWAARTDPDAELLTLADVLRRRGGTVLEFTGAAPLDDDEVTPLPGAEELALLRALRSAAEEPPPHGWDTVVVDLPPVARALRTLALPAQLRRYLDRLLPPQKQAARALRPLLAGLVGVPIPADGLYASADRLRRELAAVERLLAVGPTSVRLVVEPGRPAIEPLRTARAALALYGLRLDAVLANRVLPTSSPDPWLRELAEQQQAALRELRGVRLPGVLEVPHLGRPPQGVDDLARLGTTAAPPEPVSADDDRAPRVEDRLASEGRLHLRVPLPGARKETLGLVRRGDELLLGVGPHRRTLPLPSALRRCRVTGAAYENGELCVRFEPEPGLWPAPRS